MGLFPNNSAVIASEAFQNLDSSITAFTESIPKDLRDASCLTTPVCAHGRTQCPACGDSSPRSARVAIAGHVYELNALPHMLVTVWYYDIMSHIDAKC